MKSKLTSRILLCIFLVGTFGFIISIATITSSKEGHSLMALSNIANAGGRVVGAAEALIAAGQYRINPAESRFMANVGTGGLLWFKGHSHHFSVRDFSGEAAVTTGSAEPASLQMRVNAGSLEETGANFTEEQKKIINKEASHDVLNADQYPQIIFNSRRISGNIKPDGEFQVKIEGDLTLHGVTRSITIPANVTMDANTLHAHGQFSINRSDYKVKTKAIKGGTIRVRNKVTFEFNIVANRV